jgi:hypothetical protein
MTYILLSRFYAHDDNLRIPIIRWRSRERRQEEQDQCRKGCHKNDTQLPHLSYHCRISTHHCFTETISNLNMFNCINMCYEKLYGVTNKCSELIIPLMDLTNQNFLPPTLAKPKVAILDLTTETTYLACHIKNFFCQKPKVDTLNRLLESISLKKCQEYCEYRSESITIYVHAAKYEEPMIWHIFRLFFHALSKGVRRTIKNSHTLDFHLTSRNYLNITTYFVHEQITLFSPFNICRYG